MPLTQVQGGLIESGAITATSLANNSVTTDKIADSAITTDKIAAGAVGETDLANNAVTTVKIADSAITTAKIAAGAVVEVDIADGAVTTAKIANTAVDSTKLADNAVTVAKISATGTPSSTTFLRGDGSWQTAGGGVTSLNGQTGNITNTSLYAIGSYVMGRPQDFTSYTVNTTIAGSSLYSTAASGVWVSSSPNFWGTANQSLVNTGTWRCVSGAWANSGQGNAGLWVRIS